MEKFSRTDTSLISSWWWKIDRMMFYSVLALIVIGIVLLFSASPEVAYKIGASPSFFIKKQMVFLPLTVFAMIFFSALNEKYIKIMASLILVSSIALMVIILFKGTGIKGAKRWISLFGFTLQPSEFLKPAFAVLCAMLFNIGKISCVRIKERTFEIKGYMVALFLWFVSIGLLFLQPDFGMIITISVIFTVEAFVLGANGKLLTVLLLFGSSIASLSYIFIPHVNERIKGFFSNNIDDTYQVRTALDAIASGGIFGSGLGKSQKYIPDSHTDFILAVAIEQFGLFLAIVILSIYVFILIKGFLNASNAKSKFAITAISGLLSQFGFQALINMSSTLGMVPPKGMTLPFISYGGSSLVSTGILMGMVLALCAEGGKISYDNN